MLNSGDPKRTMVKPKSANSSLSPGEAHRVWKCGMVSATRRGGGGGSRGSLKHPLVCSVEREAVSVQRQPWKAHPTSNPGRV